MAAERGVYEGLIETQAVAATGITALMPEFQKLALDPPDRDPHLIAFYNASLHVMTDNTVPWHAELRKSVDKGLTNRERPVLTQVATNMFQRAMQWHARIHDADNFPGPNYETMGGWLKLFQEVAEDPLYGEQLEKIMREYTIQSMLEQRYAAFKMLMLSERERLGDRPSSLEIGCSGQIGQRWELSGLPAHDIDVMTPPNLFPHGRLERNQKLSIHPYLTSFIRSYLQQPFQPGISWGVDSVPLDDETLEWQYICSKRPNELKDPAARERWERLIKADMPDVKFYNADFSREGMRNFTRDTGMKYFKNVRMPTMLHQLEPELRIDAIELGKEYVEPDDGYLLIQDFAMPYLDDPRRLQFFNNWHRDWGTYRLLLADPREDFKKLHEIVIFDGGRARQMVLGHDIGKLALSKDLEPGLKDEVRLYAKHQNRIAPNNGPVDTKAYLQRMRAVAVPF
jgi:hypothetical protein